VRDRRKNVVQGGEKTIFYKKRILDFAGKQESLLLILIIELL
jgi:hypothetical protein